MNLLNYLKSLNGTDYICIGVYDKGDMGDLYCYCASSGHWKWEGLAANLIKQLGIPSVANDLRAYHNLTANMTVKAVHDFPKTENENSQMALKILL